MTKDRAISAASRRYLPGCLTAICAGTLAVSVWMFHQPVWAAVRTHPYFTIKNFVVRGTGPLLTQDEVLGWLGVQDGASFWDVSPVRVRTRLQEHPLIERARVQRDFPNHIEIDVRERKPEAIVFLDGLYYVGRNGQILRPVTGDLNRNYPVITGLGPDEAPGYRTWAFRRALRLVRLCKRAPCFGGVSEVHLDPKYGVVLYPMSPRVPITLGWGSWREKLIRASRVFQVWEGHEDRLALVDVHYGNQVLVKMRGESEEHPAKPKSQAVKATVKAPVKKMKRGVRA